MKTNYLSGYKRGSKKNGGLNLFRLGVLSIFIFIVAFCIFYLFLSPLYSFSSSIWATENKISRTFPRVAAFFIQKDSLLNQIESLKKENNELSIALINSQANKNALDVYMQSFGTTTGSSTTLVIDPEYVAKVVRRPPMSPFDTLVIDRGSDHGLKSGWIIAHNNIYVGRIKEVFEHTSLVELFTKPELISRVIIGSSAFEGVAKGKGGGFFTIEVPRDTEIKVGDVVRGVDRSSPVYGVVEYIEADEGDTMQIVYASLPFSLSYTEWIQIIKE